MNVLCLIGKTKQIKLYVDRFDYMVYLLQAIHWLGVSDIQREGQFVTLSDARKPRYSNWLKGEPNNVNNEDCLLYGIGRGGWNDGNCESKVNYVCKK